MALQFLFRWRELPTIVKILHIVYSLEPGGMENGILNMVARLPRKAVSVEICCLEKAGRMAE